MYTMPVYCTSALYTFSYTVSTNQSSVAEPYKAAAEEGARKDGFVADARVSAVVPGAVRDALPTLWG